jgi:hypothetical protein
MGAEGYCCTLSHKMTYTQTHTLGRTPLDKGSASHTDLCTTYYLHNRQPCRQRDSNPQSQHASGRTPKPYTTWPPQWISDFPNLPFTLTCLVRMYLHIFTPISHYFTLLIFLEKLLLILAILEWFSCTFR